MIDYICGTMVIVGAIFIFIAALGILRLSDLLIRMHAATKAGSLGAGLVLAGVAIHIDILSLTTQAFVAIIFILITAPVAAHVIARAAYFANIPLSKRTLVDELRNKYNAKLHTLASEEVSTDD